jgi:lipoate-protein ligase A
MALHVHRNNAIVKAPVKIPVLRRRTGGGGVRLAQNPPI